MRLRIEHGYAASYVHVPSEDRPRILPTVWQAFGLIATWRPAGMSPWQRMVCTLLASGPAVHISPDSGHAYYWPPRWLLGDRDGA